MPHKSDVRLLSCVLRRCFSRRTLLALLSLVLLALVSLHLGSLHLGESLIYRPDRLQKKPRDDVIWPGCVLPRLEVDDPVMKRFYAVPAPITCSPDPDWVYVDNGTLRFSPQVLAKLGNFSCDYFPLLRGRTDESVSWGQKVTRVVGGAPISSDYFKVDCRTTGEPVVTYTDIHLGVAPNKVIEERFSRVRPPVSGLDGLSILVLGYDSMSRMSWIRRMRQTREYFLSVLDGIELEGFNIMGDGTPAALFPILTGHHETEMYESRRKFRGARPVDDYPWIWKDFANAGYMTSWADAEVYMAPFNMRLLGFKRPPTDYYMRPYYLGVELMKKSKKYKPHCRGSLSQHKIWLDWPRDMFYMYGNRPKFMVHFYASLSHDDNNRLIHADGELKHFLQDLQDKGYLNHTVLVLMGDHGARFSQFRETWPGKLEERLPYLALRFPPWFHQKYPGVVKNVRLNKDRLSTPLDLHATFVDVLKFEGSGRGSLKHRAISLLKEIPVERGCPQANISNHWCACLNWAQVPSTDPFVVRAALTAVDKINNLTSPFRPECHKLMLHNVTLATKLEPHEDFVRFRKSVDIHGRVADFSAASTNKVVLYQITFYTRPGQGQFEVTVNHVQTSDRMEVNEKEMSRINKYGTDSLCIMDKDRQLRQFCYCKSTAST
ncbi:uncharacterized protein LOC131954013 [Physella acuta]|uniref:uncharacterized protein LOC131954013 n=1 Tax=Physella acuta TaxID=109671 RepID=UPI0027DD30EB|nr:uncharacterized protein LOC131954013 [Physella acuta]XP_059173475.1 uncharacterized protein LOC131954013 [Physella acuta]